MGLIDQHNLVGNYSNCSRWLRSVILKIVYTYTLKYRKKFKYWCLTPIPTHCSSLDEGRNLKIWTF